MKHRTYDKVGNITMSATQQYGGGNSFTTDTLLMSYDDLWRVTRKSQRLSQSNLVQTGTLHAGFDMTYNYDPAWGRHYRMKNVSETHYRTEDTPTVADSIQSIHSYAYDPNGNLEQESVARTRLDGDTTHNISERKLLWDGMNRLKAISENGYVSLYWYDPVGNRTVKEHGGGEAIWVNSKHAGTMTDTVTCSIYPNPYININRNRWTKHYYIGGERIASMTGTISGGFEGLNATGNYAAGHDSGMTIRYDNMRQAQEDSIDSTYARLGVPYRAHQTNTRGDGWYLYLPAKQADENVADGSDRGQGGSHPLTLGDGQVYFYHRDHLGSTMSVTDSIGNTVQQVEYTPWGEVFVERRFGGSDYESPCLFNSMENMFYLNADKVINFIEPMEKQTIQLSCNIKKQTT